MQRTRRDTHSGEKQPRPIHGFRYLAIGAAMVLAFVIGRVSAPSPSRDAANGVAAKSAPPSQKRSTIESVSPRIPKLAEVMELGETAPGEGLEVERRQKRATYLFERLLERLGRLPQLPGFVPESHANIIRPTIVGMVEAARALDPLSRKALSDELERRLCADRPDETKAIVFAYFASEMPEITTPNGFECFFASAQTQESAALWYMLDAWRTSGLPETRSFSSLRSSAKDERTLDRLSGNYRQTTSAATSIGLR
jgi:hypothetical protein